MGTVPGLGELSASWRVPPGVLRKKRQWAHSGAHWEWPTGWVPNGSPHAMAEVQPSSAREVRPQPPGASGCLPLPRLCTPRGCPPAEAGLLLSRAWTGPSQLKTHRASLPWAPLGLGWHPPTGVVGWAWDSVQCDWLSRPLSWAKCMSRPLSGRGSCSGVPPFQPGPRTALNCVPRAIQYFPSPLLSPSRMCPLSGE